MSIYLSDIGIVNALGSGKIPVLKGLLAGDRSGLRDTGQLLTGRRSLAGVVRERLEEISPELSVFACRNNRLLATTLDQIRPRIEEAIDTHGPERIAVIIGTSTSGIAAGETALERLAKSGSMPGNYHYRQQEIGTTAEFAARYLGLSGPRFTVSTACSSSAKAFAAAVRLILSGRCDAAIAGGCDSLSWLTLNGFDALESLAPDSCNPFSRNRRGINIGEGACVGLLSRVPAAIRLLGVGEASDAYHMAAPDPSGRGAELAIRSALSSAGVKAGGVDYINLHGTATPKNDKMEACVIDTVFGRQVPCSSTKTLIGHTLGAAGAQELGLCWLLLSEDNADRTLPPHIWDGESDPEIPRINLIGESVSWSRGVMLSNVFGFGGSNASLVLGRA